MRVQSLGYRTDLIFARYDGEIVDRGDYLVIKTPANPGFYWGNFLLFAGPPQSGDVQRWRQLFRQEIGVPLACNHETFGWDKPGTDDIRPFLAIGFKLSQNVMMTSPEPRLPEHHADFVDVRPLETEAEREAAIELQVLCRDPGHEEAGYRIFCQRQMDRYDRMSRDGLGDWYGAFYGGQLVADLGLFRDDEVGRYQSVETHPEYRRRGIAGSMVCEAGRQAIAKYGLQVLVIAAEEASAASRLYANAGFEPAETQWGLERWPVSEE